MKRVLLKPLVIPAGTVFSDAPQRRSYGGEHVEATIGLSKNSYGTVTYAMDDDAAELAEWFAPLAE